MDLTELGRAVAAFQDAAQAASRSASAAPHIGGNAAFGAAPWGADPLGASFGNQYAGPAGRLPAALEALSALLSDTADQLTRIRNGFAEADRQAAEHVVKLGRQFDGRD